MTGGEPAPDADRPRRPSPLMTFVVPGVVLAGLLAVTPDEAAWRATMEAVLVGWGAVLLMLYAGIRLGFAVTGSAAIPTTDTVATLLALAVAVLAGFVSPPHALVLLAVSHAAEGAWDAFGVGRGAVPEDYARQRTRSTFVTVAVLIAGFVASA